MLLTNPWDVLLGFPLCGEPRYVVPGNLKGSRPWPAVAAEGLGLSLHGTRWNPVPSPIHLPVIP